MPVTTTVASLAQLQARFSRLWHYRQYDTVSDPSGLIRDWLDRNATLAEDHAITGRDYLRLQRYDFHQGTMLPLNSLSSADKPRFAERLELTAVDFASTSPAGNFLYVATRWRMLTSAPGLAELGLSLRLYGPDDLLLVQADTALTPLPLAAADGLKQVVLALPIPAAARPITYTMAMLVYEQANGQPLLVTQADDQGERFELGRVKVTPTARSPVISQRLASFGYLDLVGVALPVQQQAGELLPLDLVWQPRPSPYQDTFVVAVGLQGADGAAQTLGEEPLAGWDYPSGSWPALLPVLHQMRLPLPANLPHGRYQVTLQVLRASDRQVIPLVGGRPWSENHSLVIGDLEIGKVAGAP
jgi:hypothetical protein